jgi:hypothetical protein
METVNEVWSTPLHARTEDYQRSTELRMIWVPDSQLLPVKVGTISLVPTSGAIIASPSGPTCSAAPSSPCKPRV